MEMWLKRSTTVFLAVAVAAVVISGQEPVTLDKNGTSVTRRVGSPLILKCNLNTMGYLRMRVYWHFNPSGDIFDKSQTLYSKMYNRSAKTSTVVPDKRKVDDKDDEQILYNYNSSATYNDSGWYFCRIEIEIPTYVENFSAGTKVAITESEEHATHPSRPLVTVKKAESEEHATHPSRPIVKVKKAPVSPTANFQLWHWIVLGVSAFILIVLPIMCILLRKRCRINRAEDPIYANTRPVLSKQPSPRPRSPADTLKTASSSQNLQNPSPKRYDDGKRRHRR